MQKDFLGGLFKMFELNLIYDKIQTVLIDILFELHFQFSSDQ